MKRILGAPKQIFEFIRSVFSELRAVEYPTRRYTLRMTSAVLGISVVATLLLLGIDTLFTIFRNYLTTN